MPQGGWRAYALAGVFLLGLVFMAFYGAYLGGHQSETLQKKQAGDVEGADRSAERGTPSHAVPESPEGRIADYTWWVGAFTLLLALVSGSQTFFLIRADNTARITAEAAKKSADSAVAMERPMVFLESLHLGESSFDLRTRIETPSVIIRFRNYGRSPAYLVGSHFHYLIGPTLPATPQYDVGVDRTEVIESGKDVSWIYLRPDFRPTPEQVESVIAGTASLWMYGVLIYEDFAGEEHETGFCGSWKPSEAGDTVQLGFMRPSRSPYIYRT